MFNLHIPHYVLLTLIGTSLPACANELWQYNLEELMDIPVTIATDRPRPLRLAPAVASVITEADIRAMGAISLEQALESIPGLHISSLFGYADKPIYSFRGIFTQHNPQVLVLIDGTPQTQTFTGDRGGASRGYPLAQIARIEVIRGPGSALYGADAFAGVINIITKTAQHLNGLNIGGRIGSFNHKDAWLQYGGQLGAIDSVVYAHFSESDGSRGMVAQDAQTFYDGCFSTGKCPAPFNTAIPNYTPKSLAPAAINNSRKSAELRTDFSYQQWRLRLGYQQDKASIGALAGSLDPYSAIPTDKLYWELRYTENTPSSPWKVSAGLSYFDAHEHPSDPPYMLFPPGAFGGAYPNGMYGNPGHAQRNYSTRLTLDYQGMKAHQLKFGIGYRLDDMYKVQESKNFDTKMQPLPQGYVDVSNDPNQVYILPQKRHLTYAFVQDEWEIRPDWTLTAGIRHDRYSDFGSTTNPRLALVWDAAYNFSFKIMHGQAFRAPSFTEQYNMNNPVVVGNPNIKPEHMHTNEVALMWRPSLTLQTNLNFFHYKLSGLIRPSRVGLINTYANHGTQAAKGMELEIRWDANRDLRITGHAQIQHAIDGATGEYAGLAPHQRVFANADWQFQTNWFVSGTANWVMNRKREPGDTRPQLADYALFNLGFRRENIEHYWDLRMQINNLFNQNAKEPSLLTTGMPSDAPLAKRAIWVSLERKM